MKKGFLHSAVLIIISFLLQSCGTYKTFTGTVKYDASRNNEVIKSVEFKSYLESRDKIKFVLRSPEGFTSFPKDEQKKMNEIFSQIEKELILNGHIVKDRFLLELLLDKGDMSLQQVGKAIDTDIIIEIIDIDFNIPNHIKSFSIKEKGINTNFDNWNNKGGLTMEQRANTRYKEILENYKEPDMDDAARKNLDAYINSIRNT